MTAISIMAYLDVKGLLIDGDNEKITSKLPVIN